MKFTVSWKPSAQNDLARMWVAADPEDRQEITLAANTIDKQLMVNPQSLGESRSQDRRILFMPPLVVIFEVLEQDRTVWVLTVNRVSRR